MMTTINDRTNSCLPCSAGATRRGPAALGILALVVMLFATTPNDAQAACGFSNNYPVCGASPAGALCEWTDPATGLCGLGYIPVVTSQTPSNYPIVFLFHGALDKVENLAAKDRYLWQAKADAEQFVVIYPQALSGGQVCEVPTWNATHCCGEAFRDNRPDVADITSFVNVVKNSPGIDGARVFATGFSNGAMLVHKLAAEQPSLFTAVAPVAGTTGGNGGNCLDDNGDFTCQAGIFGLCVDPGMDTAVGGTDGTCTQNTSATVLEVNPIGAVPIMMIHGYDDDSVMLAGGLSLGLDRDRCDLGQDEAASLWTVANGSTTPGLIDVPVFNGYVANTYAGGATVIHITATRTDHSWPGASGDPANNSPQGPYSVTATDLIWDYLFGTF